MRVSVIVAMAENGVIGRGNQLPWRLSGDLKYFKAVTLGKPVVMGRKTFESIGKPLPGRPNVVLTHDRDWHAEGVRVAHTVPEALDVAHSLAECGEVMVIGGAAVFAAVYDVAERIYLTEVHAEVDGDVVLPPFDRTVWHEVSRQRVEDEDLPYSFVVLERNR